MGIIFLGFDKFHPYLGEVVRGKKPGKLYSELNREFAQLKAGPKGEQCPHLVEVIRAKLTDARAKLSAGDQLAAAEEILEVEDLLTRLKSGEELPPR